MEHFLMYIFSAESVLTSVPCSKFYFSRAQMMLQQNKYRKIREKYKLTRTSFVRTRWIWQIMPVSLVTFLDIVDTCSFQIKCSLMHNVYPKIKWYIVGLNSKIEETNSALNIGNLVFRFLPCSKTADGTNGYHILGNIPTNRAKCRRQRRLWVE